MFRLARTATRKLLPRSSCVARRQFSNGCPMIFNEEDTMLQESVRGFAKEEIQPLIHTMDANAQLDLGLLQKLFDQGLMSVHVPEQYDGAGMGFLQSCIVIEELAKVDPAVSVICDVHNTLVNTIMLKYASDALKEQYLPRLSTNTLGSFCLSETSSGSDAFAMKATANREGDTFVLNGSKLWITNAKEADIFLVMANTDISKGYKGITCFLVEKGTPGLTIGKKEDKLGIRASSTCEVILENVEVPLNQVVGEIGKGYKIAIESLNEGRIGIGAQMVGLAQGAFDQCLPYIHQRKQFGVPVASFQGMQYQVAEMKLQIETARLLVYNAARLFEAGHPFTMEAALAKLHASRVAQSVSSQCIDMVGGVGFTKEFPFEKYYRDSKVGTIYEGTSNLQLSTIEKLLRADYQ